MAKKTYEGSCHCGRVRFQADLDLSAPTIRCNCTYCTKARNWFATTEPGGFSLLAGESDLADYQFGPQRIHHQFCRHCGVRPFARLAAEGMAPFLAVALSSLDGVDPGELAAAPITYVDGRNDDFESAPAETRHL